jgi:hypothetical protein
MILFKTSNNYINIINVSILIYINRHIFNTLVMFFPIVCVKYTCIQTH